MANAISVLRVLLGFLAISLVFSPTPTAYWVAFGLTVAVIWMDGLDGYVARKFNQASKFGAVVDILGDRIVELTYWIAFATLHWIPLWVALLVMTRGIVVDGLRAMALEQGFTAFGATSMMQNPVGVFFVSSRASRWLYAVCKAIAFALLILAHLPIVHLSWQPTVSVIAYLATYISVLFCIARGLPVILEARRFIKQ